MDGWAMRGRMVGSPLCSRHRTAQDLNDAAVIVVEWWASGSSSRVLLASDARSRAVVRADGGR